MNDTLPHRGILGFFSFLHAPSLGLVFFVLLAHRKPLVHGDWFGPFCPGTRNGGSVVCARVGHTPFGIDWCKTGNGARGASSGKTCVAFFFALSKTCRVGRRGHFVPLFPPRSSLFFVFFRTWLRDHPSVWEGGFHVFTRVAHLRPFLLPGDAPPPNFSSPNSRPVGLQPRLFPPPPPRTTPPAPG